eukprot:4471534-Alexandrium_andersonii.AAC.1
MARARPCVGPRVRVAWCLVVPACGDVCRCLLCKSYPEELIVAPILVYVAAPLLTLGRAVQDSLEPTSDRHILSRGSAGWASGRNHLYRRSAQQALLQHFALRARS